MTKRTLILSNLMTSLLATCLLIVAPGTRAAEDLPDDNALQTRIATAIADSEDYADALVQVHSHRGFVLLTGQVTSAAQKAQATNAVVLASNAIRRVINELEPVAEVDRSTLDSDAALAAAIETDLLAFDPALAAQVQVVVHRARVYLMGALPQADGSRVAERVSFVPGVAGIKTSFEVLPAN